MWLENLNKYATLILVIITAYYAWQVRKTLEEQKRAVAEQKKASELMIAPNITFEFTKEGESRFLSFPDKETKGVEKKFSREKPQKIGVSCCVKRNNIYNLIMKILINGELKGEKNIGSVIIHPEGKYQYTKWIDITEYLKGITNQFDLCLEISYESRSGSTIIERYCSKCNIKDDGIYDIPIFPMDRKIVSAPWL